jgi:hypothetical protein
LKTRRRKFLALSGPPWGAVKTESSELVSVNRSLIRPMTQAGTITGRASWDFGVQIRGVRPLRLPPLRREFAGGTVPLLPPAMPRLSETESRPAEQRASRAIMLTIRSWSGTASIRRPPVFQTGALPTELPDLQPNPKWIRSAGATGFEPATSGLTGRRTLQAVLRPRDVADSDEVRGDRGSIDLTGACSTSGGVGCGLRA